jgi:hypothetical protein
MCRPCLGWSERRPHIAGKPGAAIRAQNFYKGYVRRIEGTRALDIAPPGRQALRDMFGVRELGWETTDRIYEIVGGTYIVSGESITAKDNALSSCSPYAR